MEPKHLEKPGGGIKSLPGCVEVMDGFTVSKPNASGPLAVEDKNSAIVFLG